MTDLKVEVDPAEVGFDAKRLGRIEEYFRAYVDDGRLPGWLVTVARDGKLVYLAEYGQRDREAGLPVEQDTIWRIYSMTKPITSLAVMMLWEQGAFDLNDPIEAFIPGFAGGRVYTGGSVGAPETAPVTQPIRIWNLLTHTSGLSYGQSDHPVDQGYRQALADAAEAGGTDLAARVEVWARQPLLFEPGTRWQYSVATDVLGRLVEVVSGRSLDAYFAEQILGPLQMTDTGFEVPEARATARPWRTPPRRAGPTWPPGSRCGRASRSSSSPAPAGSTRWPPTCWGGWSRWSPASRWTPTSPSRSWGRCR